MWNKSATFAGRIYIPIKHITVNRNTIKNNYK